MKTKVLLLLSFILVGSLAIKGQDNINFCASAKIVNDYLISHPELVLKRDKLESFTNQFILSNQAQKSAGAKYIIPVVFHVLYQSTVDNISEAQIMDQMTILNEDFRMLNADISTVVSAFQGVIGDMEIEFRLAKKDPQGNATNGIDRISSAKTVESGQNVAKINQWPPDKYLNIWVVKTAALSSVGYTYFPYLADTQPQYDGIVIRNDAVGKTGTAASSMWNRGSLTHEIGHWLNLMHLWGSSNSPGSASNCNDDDGVTDTPNEVGATFGSCKLTGQSCGVLNNAQNFMTYTFCGVMFTEGQKLRAQAALNATLAKRNKIWSSTNLIATGVDSPSTSTEINKKNPTFTLYPNPAENYTTINLTVPESQTLSITLKDILGKTYYSSQKRNLATGSYDFIIETNLPRGIYFVEIFSETFGNTLTKKLVVQ